MPRQRYKQRQASFANASSHPLSLGCLWVIIYHSLQVKFKGSSLLNSCVVSLCGTSIFSSYINNIDLHMYEYYIVYTFQRFAPSDDRNNSSLKRFVLSQVLHTYYVSIFILPLISNDIWQLDLYI